MQIRKQRCVPRSIKRTLRWARVYSHAGYSQPLVDRKAITARADSVACLLANYSERVAIAEQLDALFDLERIAQKSAFSSVRYRVIWPVCAVRSWPSRRCVSKSRRVCRISAIASTILQALHEELERTLVDEPAATLVDGGVIRAEHRSRFTRMHRIAFARPRAPQCA